jgi:hypothetical protein
MLWTDLPTYLPTYWGSHKKPDTSRGENSVHDDLKKTIASGSGISINLIRGYLAHLYDGIGLLDGIPSIILGP